MRRWRFPLSVLVLGGLAFWFSDLSSKAWLLSVILPLLVALALVSLMVWLVLFLYEEGFDDAWFAEGETEQGEESGEGGPVDVDDGGSPG